MTTLTQTQENNSYFETLKEAIENATNFSFLRGSSFEWTKIEKKRITKNEIIEIDKMSKEQYISILNEFLKNKELFNLMGNFPRFIEGIKTEILTPQEYYEILKKTFYIFENDYRDNISVTLDLINTIDIINIKHLEIENYIDLLKHLFNQIIYKFSLFKNAENTDFNEINNIRFREHLKNLISNIDFSPELELLEIYFNKIAEAFYNHYGNSSDDLFITNIEENINFRIKISNIFLELEKELKK